MSGGVPCYNTFHPSTHTRAQCAHNIAYNLLSTNNQGNPETVGDARKLGPTVLVKYTHLATLAKDGA